MVPHNPEGGEEVTSKDSSDEVKGTQSFYSVFKLWCWRWRFTLGMTGLSIGFILLFVIAYLMGVSVGTGSD